MLLSAAANCKVADRKVMESRMDEQFDEIIEKMRLYRKENVKTADKCVKLEDNNISLASQLGLSNTRAEQLESLLSESQEEHEDTKAKLKMQKQKAECSQTALEKVTEEKRRLQEKVDRKSAANYELLQRVDNLTHDVVSKDRQNENINKELSALKKEKEILQISFNKLSTEKQILEGDVQKKSEANLELLERVEKLTHDVASKDRQNENTIKELSALNKEKQILQMSFNKLSTEKQILERDVQKKSEANLELLERVEKLKHALLSRESEIRSLNKEQATTEGKRKDLQVACEKLLLANKNIKKLLGKEKLSRAELSEKSSTLEREKNAEILKIKNKLDATKKFFANSNKLIVTSPVTRENSVQYEEKTKKPKRRRSGKLRNTGSVELMSPKEGEDNGKEIQQGKQEYKEADRGKEGRTRSDQGQDEQHNQDIISSNVKDVKIEQKKLCKDDVFISPQTTPNKELDAPYKGWIEMMKYLVVFLMCFIWLCICILVTGDY